MGVELGIADMCFYFLMLHTGSPSVQHSPLLEPWP